MSLTTIFSPISILRRLREDGAAATLNRLGVSRHVADLRLMFAATFYVVVVGCFLAFIFICWRNLSDNWRTEVLQPHTGWLWLRFFLDSAVSAAPVIGAIIALSGGIIAWTYQSGSERLGIVDLFACEISTLCRVCTITGLTRRYVDAFNADLGINGPPDPEVVARTRKAFSHYDPSESYTPVFDHNAADLRVLDVRVVTNVTAFYTYLKAMKDTLRSLAKITSTAAVGDENDPWHEAMKSVLYMQFLAFESARKAVRDLIEFDPNQVENTVTILIGEVRAYHFLIKHYGSTQGNAKEDFRHARLRLRYASYRGIIGRAYWQAVEGDKYRTDRATLANETASRLRSSSRHWYSLKTTRRRVREAAFETELSRQWHKAAETAQELKNCYSLLFGDEKIERPVDLLPPGAIQS